MKFYLLMLLALLVIFSGCTQTGEIIEKAADSPTGQEPNESAATASGNATQEQEPGPGESADLCEGAVCGRTIKTCPDGFVSTCSNPCDPETGDCLPCKPDCTGHEITTGITECNLKCGTCEVLDEVECACNLKLFCSGNGICESGEYPSSGDCPDCDDGNECTQDSYDYGLKTCIHETIIPCTIPYCGNAECEEGEDEGTCPEDCLEEQEGDVRIIFIDYSSPKEWVELEGYNVDMTDWSIWDEANHNYTFSIFMINGKVKLHKGYGEDNETDLFWQSDSYIWNNDGDTATLKDDNGEVVDTYSY